MGCPPRTLDFCLDSHYEKGLEHLPPPLKESSPPAHRDDPRCAPKSKVSHANEGFQNFMDIQVNSTFGRSQVVAEHCLASPYVGNQ